MLDEGRYLLKSPWRQFYAGVSLQEGLCICFVLKSDFFLNITSYDFLVHSISTLVNVIPAQFFIFLFHRTYLSDTINMRKYMYITAICLVHQTYRLYTLIAVYLIHFYL